MPGGRFLRRATTQVDDFFRQELTAPRLAAVVADEKHQLVAIGDPRSDD